MWHYHCYLQAISKDPTVNINVSMSYRNINHLTKLRHFWHLSLYLECIFLSHMAHMKSSIVWSYVKPAFICMSEDGNITNWNEMIHIQIEIKMKFWLPIRRLDQGP